MVRFLFFSFFFVIHVSVFSYQQTAQEIVDKAIEKAGGTVFDQSVIHFSFRGKQYRSERRKGVYQLERKVVSDTKEVHDVVSNKGLLRRVNGCAVTVADSLVTKISDGVNSVHYFAMLPYGLNAAAVNKTLAGETVLKGEPYYKIKVTFDQEGGGTDYEDEFMYWIHKERYTVDYLAYKYAVNGGGIRFREGYNPRVVSGIRFADYKNYKTEVLHTDLSQLDTLFETGKLKQVSVIALEDIHVYVLKEDCC
ncbi:deoxyribose-phosphate aldolase [Aquimarina sp. TRL1]|uniref:DUF6503 family protein n=1 Tax=Aquimarina sp. (strain TRL1) TaxID=2736252 RepID=UPI00158AD10D|nr:DUF6503 family protein [Aquimarina sp. TRL1]QKX07436.1 deoxyribose-phosphate aldolase [Aquimarina sp. TRL1]